MKQPYRQGDIALVPVVAVPHGKQYIARQRGQGIVIAEGEATGHHHRVRSRSAREFRVGSKRYLAVGVKGAELTHEEHDPIAVAPGAYEIIQQREFAPPPETRRDTSSVSTRRDWEYVRD